MAAGANRGWVKKGYWGLVQGEKFIGHFFLLIIRLYWGSLFVVTGVGKWMHLYGVADYFSSLQIPFPLFSAGFVASLEVLGGISLFFGFVSRIFSFLLTILLATAYATAHKEALSQTFSHPSPFITQAPFLYLYAALVVLCFGPGLFSIDYWLERKAYGNPL